MKDASVKAYNNLHSARAKTWTEKSTKEYLKAQGLNEPLIKNIMKSESKEDMLKCLPPVWNTEGDVCTHIETIMHLVFLGVSQTVGKVLKETLTAFKLFRSFHNNDNDL